MARTETGHGTFEHDPLWYKDAIIYELRVGAFQDSNGDGIGDFRGLAQRLDYLQDLGVTMLWLLPFCPSPLRDDGYDISDYNNVHPQCGTLADFKLFLRAAHQRGMRVMTELVVNHTSDQHPWFQRARRAPPGSQWRNFYVWSDTPEQYHEARVIFRDFEPSNWTWDPVAKAYYWHRFFAHQPDLNFDSPLVRKAVVRFLDFWLSLGVDGLRLDAIPYLYERDGTTCENLPETHAFLKELRRHIDTNYENRMLLAEANQWSEEAVAYFGNGDECHMSFHFPIMPRLFMSLHMEDRFPIIDILTETPGIPENCQWALFLRNHDELTLEMVTDEERDYMYRVYAHDAHARLNLGIRRRLAPLLGKDRRRMELMNALLFSLPGTPVIYYGDEIGMGDNIYLGDRNGVRTPMQWSADRNAGFSRANPQRLYLPVIVDPEFHYESINVEAQQNNTHSFLWWTKRLIALRKRHKAFGRGSIEFLSPSNRKVLAFVRRYQDERILVVANLSRFVQYVELDLAAYKDTVVVELFGRNRFPAIRDQPYLLTLGPHSFYWFALEAAQPQTALTVTPAEIVIPVVHAKASWETLIVGPGKTELEKLFPTYLQGRRWFGGKARPIKATQITDALPLPNSSPAYIVFIRVEYLESGTETYAVPLAFAAGQRADELRRTVPLAVVAAVDFAAKNGRSEGVLYDALEESGFSAALLDAIARRRSIKGTLGEIAALPTRAFRNLRGPNSAPLAPSMMHAEQSNTSVTYGDRLVLKMFRRVEEGINPDFEIGRFLTERVGFPHISPVAGTLEYRVPRREVSTVAILHGFVPNEGDAWRYTVDQVKGYFERALVRGGSADQVPVPDRPLLTLVDEDPPALVEEMFSGFQETARLLGQRTAELHLALASDAADPAFAPEPFTRLYQRSLYQSIRNLIARVFRLLRDVLPDLQEAAVADARDLLATEDRVRRAAQAALAHKLNALRIRCHGDYHLGQILHTGKDFVIIDFEGEPAQSLAERRLKRSPLRDVAGMLRSFDYAVSTVLLNSEENGMIRPEDLGRLQPWARFWTRWVSSAFLRAYLQRTIGTGLVPQARVEQEALLNAMLLEKNVYELAYELDNRPGWVRVPIRGIRELIGEMERAK